MINDGQDGSLIDSDLAECPDDTPKYCRQRLHNQSHIAIAGAHSVLCDRQCSVRAR